MTFTYTVTAADWARIAPELVLIGMTLIALLVDLLLPQTGRSRKDSGAANFVILPIVSLLGILGALTATITLFIVGDNKSAFNNMIGSDQGSLYGYIIILSAAFLAILFSPAYLKRLKLVHQGEYYALLLLAVIGMMLLLAADSFLTVFLGIEMLSLALYILCGFVDRRRSSQEAGMKYFLLSSFASAFLLYGIALTYGATGGTAFASISDFLSRHAQSAGHLVSFNTRIMLLMGIGLLVVGFAFKVSAIPFQAWTPDVYEGAPAPITAFMSVGTKAAALIAFAHVFNYALNVVRPDWTPIVWTITILTIIGGNVLALVQSNVKRLLAYSSIAHAGYLLIGVVVGGAVGFAAILFYLLCYTFLNMGAFGVVSLLENPDNTGNDTKDIRGLWYRQPVLAGFLAFFLFALAGFPPMAGFAGKYYLFYAALQGGHPELLIIGVLTSVLGMYYYLRIIASMFMEQETLQVQITAERIPATPLPASTARRVPASAKGRTTAATRTGSLTPSRGGAAVAVKTPTTGLQKVSAPAVSAREPEQIRGLSWMTWTGLGIAALGTLAMGTLLPLWLVGLAQQAAQIIAR